MTTAEAVETIVRLKQEQRFRVWDVPTHREYAEAITVFLSSGPDEEEFQRVLAGAPWTARAAYALWTTPPPRRSDALGVLE